MFDDDGIGWSLTPVAIETKLVVFVRVEATNVYVPRT